MRIFRFMKYSLNGWPVKEGSFPNLSFRVSLLIRLRVDDFGGGVMDGGVRVGEG